MLDIGGFFGLELARGRRPHGGAMALNSGRNALRVLLGSTGVKRIRIPVYGCPALVPAIRAEGVQIDYYRVTPELEPDSLPPPGPDEAVLLINYFGLKAATVNRYADRYRNVIVDQCQAFFADPPPALGCIYSPRKFVGVADGGYLYGPAGLTADLAADKSAARYIACLRRVDAGGAAAYSDYQRVEAEFAALPPALMSRLTRTILASIDYTAIARRRRKNFAVLHAALGIFNTLSLRLDEGTVPMAYPLVSDAPGLRDHLIERGVYVPRYWPDPQAWLPRDPVSDMLSRQLLALPIDQRYDTADMHAIASLITEYASRTGAPAHAG